VSSNKSLKKASNDVPVPLSSRLIKFAKKAVKKDQWEIWQTDGNHTDCAPPAVPICQSCTHW